MSDRGHTVALPAWVDEDLHGFLMQLYADVNDAYGEARAMSAVLEEINKQMVERLSKKIEEGCPTYQWLKKPCFACHAAAERVRKCLA